MDDFSLVPVEHQPDFSDVSLVPVDHDPFGAEGVTQQGPVQQPQTETQPAQPVPQTQQPAAGANDFFKSIPRGIVSGFNSAASALARATQAEMGQDVDAPTPEQGMEILEKEVTGPMHRPEGRAGKFGASVGEFLGNPASYLVPGSLPFKVGTAVLGGLGSEAGGQLGEGTPLEIPFRFAGGALGGLGSAGLGAGVRAAETLVPAAENVSAALRNATPKQVAFAHARSDAIEGAGRSGSGELSANAPTGNFYSVLYETKLKPTSYPGLGRPAHNQEGNENLLQEMEGDDAFARGLQNQNVVLQRTPTGLAPRTPPAGFSWHHAEEPGVLQLVPREQHDRGSIFQDILHPDGRGGYSKWGK